MLRQILSEHPITGIMGICKPRLKPGTMVQEVDEDGKVTLRPMTEAEAEQRAFDDFSAKPFHKRLNVRFAAANTDLNDKDHPHRVFRNGLRDNVGVVFFNIPECKDIAHVHRKEKRDKDMKPFDDIVSLDVPGQDAAAAEVERKKIRDADALKQTRIDNATTIEELAVEIPQVP